MKNGWHRVWEGVAGAIVCAALLFVFALFTSPSPTLAANGNNYDQNITVDSAKRRATTGMALMGKNGLLAAITKHGGDLEKEMQAIAIRESNGVLGAENKASMAYCAFQVYHTWLPTLAAKNNMTYNQYRNALMTSPDLCAQAGAEILKYHISKQGKIGGLCGYAGAGEYKIFQRTGTCPNYNHIRIFKAAIAGTLTYEVLTDVESPDYASYIIRGVEGDPITIINCHDPEKEFARALAKAQEAYTTALFADTDEAAAVQTGKMIAEPTRYQKGKILDTYCLGMYLDYMGLVRKLLRGAAIIDVLIEALAQQVMNAICEYAVAFLQDVVLSMLNNLCIPLPDINLRLSLKGMARKSCGANTLSMADILSTSYGIDLKEIFKEGGTPPVNGSPTMYEHGSPGLFYEMRRQ